MKRIAVLAMTASLLPSAASLAQELSFEEYEPKSTLVVPAHPTPRAQFPFVDVHSHHRVDRISAQDVDRIVAAMDAMNMAVMVNLSGGSGETLRRTIEMMKARHPKRFVVFANVDLSKIDEPGFGEAAARQLEADVRAGAQGLKIYKNLGMFLTDARGERVRTDDARLDPIWRKAGELGIPVLIHTGEPSPFWEAFDRHNERWLELKQFPSRRRDDPKFASFEQTMAEQHALFRRHPDTTFINAHLGWLGNDLGRLGRLMDEIPNMMTEIGAVLAELGRQPRAARAFLIRYQDRVLFGKDSWAPAEYPVYFRTFETADEYFDYYRRRHANWKIYGLDLPEEVLRKIYYENALRIIPGLDRSLFPRSETSTDSSPQTLDDVTPKQLDVYRVALLYASEYAPGVSSKQRERYAVEHLANLRKNVLAGNLLAAGPLQVGQEQPLRVIAIADGSMSAEELRALFADDPFVTQRIMRLEIVPWMISRGSICWPETPVW